MCFAVRGGRHCFEPYSLSNGIILDVSKINHVNLNSKKTRAKIGSGALLGNIYSSLLDSGRFLPAGTRPTVGINQALNGGIGYSTRKFGVLTDSVTKYRIILANGELVTASKKYYPDLYWALRGCGAGNFGVVVEYEIKVYPAPNVTVFTFNYPFNEDNDNKDAVSALRWLTEIHNDNELTCQAVISKDKVALTGQGFFTPDKLFQQLKGLPQPQTSEIKYVTYREAVAYFSAPTAAENAKAKSRFFDKAMCYETIRKLIKFVATTPLPEGARLSIGFQQLKGEAKGSMPWHQATYWLNWSLRWLQDRPPINLDLKMLEKSYLETLKDPSATPWSYMGMIDRNSHNWRKAYYGCHKNRSKLVAIKQKYDPDNMFRYKQGISKLL